MKSTIQNTMKGIALIVLTAYVGGCALGPKPEPLPPPTIQETYGLKEQTLYLGPNFAGIEEGILSVSDYEISFVTVFPGDDVARVLNPVKNIAMLKHIVNDSTTNIMETYTKGADFYPHQYDPYILTVGRIHDSMEERMEMMDEPSPELQKIQNRLVEYLPEILTQFK
ncbi:MAG: hypothetical protein ABIB43_00340 [archaeon]